MTTGLKEQTIITSHHPNTIDLICKINNNKDVAECKGIRVSMFSVDRDES